MRSKHFTSAREKSTQSKPCSFPYSLFFPLFSLWSVEGFGTGPAQRLFILSSSFKFDPCEERSDILTSIIPSTAGESHVKSQFEY